VFVNSRFAVLATALLVATSLKLGDEVPQPDRGEFATPDSAASCDSLLSYQEDLFAVFDDHEDFMDYWNTMTPREARLLSDEDAMTIVEDGRALLDDLDGLEIPAVYADAGKGISTYFQFQIDYLVFMVIDTSTAPDLNQAQESFVLMHDGEIATAEACPDEVDEAGGYIWVDPDSLTDAVGG
jgi:hypothetical protein